MAPGTLIEIEIAGHVEVVRGEERGLLSSWTMPVKMLSLGMMDASEGIINESMRKKVSRMKLTQSVENEQANVMTEVLMTNQIEPIHSEDHRA